MGWVALFIVLMILGACLESVPGKIVIGSGVAAIGSLLLAWITDVDFFISFAKACAVVIVVVITCVILLAIIGE